MKDYIVVQSSSQVEFEKEVNEKLQEGYKIVPNSFHYAFYSSIAADMYTQAMIKEE